MKQNNELHNCLLSNFCNLISVWLDNSNYVTWKFLLETMLKGCGLLRYVDGSFPCPPRHMIREEDGVTSEITQQYMNWEQNDSVVMSILAATLSSDVLSFVVGCKTSRELWCLLKERAFSPSMVTGMQWRPGSSFLNQNEAVLFRGRTEIAPNQRKKFMQRLQKVQQQGQCTIVSLPTLAGGNSKKFSVQQQASDQVFEKKFNMGFEKDCLVSDLVDKKREDFVGTDVSLAEIQKFIQETKSVNEANCKKGFANSIFTALGKETESKNLFDVKKKQLVEEVTATLASAKTIMNDERRIGDLGLQSGTDAAASQLSIPTQPSFMSNSPSMISTTSFGISNHKISVSATQTSNLSEWQQAILKGIDTLPLQDIWQLSSTPLDNTSLHCRPASRPVVLCQSVPLIPPG